MVQSVKCVSLMTSVQTPGLTWLGVVTHVYLIATKSEAGGSRELPSQPA